MEQTALKKIKEEIEDLKRKVLSNKVPIGSIVASVLDYQAFLELNKLDTEITEIEKVTWVPCDGRNVYTSIYSSYKAHVPDLRGVFLRGINDMGVNGFEPIKLHQANPENKAAGDFQADTFASHHHSTDNAREKNGSPHESHDSGPNNVPGGRSYWRSGTIRTETSSTGNTETRPKNITVYYYIRIN